MIELRHTWPLVWLRRSFAQDAQAVPSAPSATNAPSQARLGAKPEAIPTGTNLPIGADPVSLDPASFSANITNPYWPMKPGTRWIYRNVEDGQSSAGHCCRRHDHHEEVGQWRHGSGRS